MMKAILAPTRTCATSWQSTTKPWARFSNKSTVRCRKRRMCEKEHFRSNESVRTLSCKPLNLRRFCESAEENTDSHRLEQIATDFLGHASQRRECTICICVH